MEVPKKLPTIPEFYEGKSVFITGGMGFLGKVLVEKILRSCPRVENIYLLCRSKKGKKISERLSEITETPVFDELRQKNPEQLKKIILIEGDVNELKFGISKKDLELLNEKVSIVIHSAATIYFNEPLKIAGITNLRGVREMLAILRDIKNLKSFVHISTAYTNWYELDVAEKVYPAAHNPDDIIKMCETLSQEELDKMTGKLLGKHTNTYTFTKNLSESLIKRDVGKLPIAIVRPAIVSASIDEPLPGWIDSPAGTAIFMYAISMGTFRASGHCKNHPFSIIPVDLVINLTLAASWKVAMEKQYNPKVEHPIVYHSTTGEQNKITLESLIESSRDYGRIYPYGNAIWYPKIRCYRIKFLRRIDNFLTQKIPAHLMDFVAKVTGNKQRAVKTQQFMEKNYNDVAFAAENPYIFQTKKYQSLQESLRPADRKTFYFDPKLINWNTYLDDYNMGIKKYMIKDKHTDQAARISKMNRLKYSSYLLNTTLALTTLYVVGKAVGFSFKPKAYKKSVDRFELGTLNVG